MLDVDYSFALARNTIEHLSDRQRIRPAIVTGIAYAVPSNCRLNHTRDYTPYFVKHGGYGDEYQAVSGGAPQFKQFFEQELIPFIDQHFRSSGKRYLVGHSFGGLFASRVAVTYPTLFNGYFIVSPSLWYADKRLLNSISNELTPPLSADLFLAVDDNEINRVHDMVADIKKYSRQKSISRKTLRAK